MSTSKGAGIDRRYLYILLFILASIPILYPLNLPVTIGEHSTLVFEITDELPAGSIVVSSFDFGPATITENRPQAKAHLFHCRQLGLRVVATAFWAAGGPLGHSVLTEVYGENYELSEEYGTEIVFIGYIPGAEVGMQTFGDDPWQAKGTDHYGTAISDLPLMQEVRSAADVDLWAEWTSGTPGEQQVIQFVQGRHQGENPGWPETGYMPLVVGSTAVSVPGMMPFYQADQILGILNGLAGGGEYELQLIDAYEYALVAALPLLDSQSVGHVLIILFIAIGNIGWAIGKSGGGRGS